MRTASVTLLLTAALATNINGDCKTAQCRNAMAWKTNFVSVVLDDDITPPKYQHVLSTIRALSGRVAIETESVLLAWLPVASERVLMRDPAVRHILRTRDPQNHPVTRHQSSVEALDFFANVMSGKYEDAVEEGLARPVPPRNGCVITRPVPPTQATVSHSDARSAERSTAGRERSRGTISRTRPKDVSAQFWNEQPWKNPSMLGRITVQVFRVDSSNGPYSWTTEDAAYARDQVLGSFVFWADQAAQRGRTLSFAAQMVTIVTRPARTTATIPVNFEPIQLQAGEAYLWMNDALATLPPPWIGHPGYGMSTPTEYGVYTNNDRFNEDRRTAVYPAYDGSFSVYLVYNPGSETSFANSGTSTFSMYDGPFTVSLWNDNGAGPALIGRIMNHETPHIFWACDEYRGGCESCLSCHASYKPSPRPHITNDNCDTPAGCKYPRDACIMTADLDYAVCDHTAAQIGW